MYQTLYVYIYKLVRIQSLYQFGEALNMRSRLIDKERASRMVGAPEQIKLSSLAMRQYLGAGYTRFRAVIRASYRTVMDATAISAAWLAHKLDTVGSGSGSIPSRKRSHRPLRSCVPASDSCSLSDIERYWPMCPKYHARLADRVAFSTIVLRVHSRSAVTLDSCFILPP